MLNLLLGKDWIANRDEILSLIREDVQKEQGGRILMVPELISHDTERRLAAMAGDTSSRYAQVLSFSRLGRRICDLVGNGAEETLDNGGRVVAMAAATHQLHSRLKAYAAVETKPEFLSGLVDAVDEFKRCCITAEDLMIASTQTEGSLAQKLEELSMVLESYDAVCQQGKRDPRSQMTWVLEQLEDMDFAENHVFYIDGFPDFTRQHMAILAHLIANSSNVTISLNCDEPDSHDPAFETAGRTARQLLQIAEELNVPVQIRWVEGRKDALSVVRHRLFRGKTTEQDDLSNVVRACRAGSIYQECQAAAEEIMEGVYSGVRYRDHALVCPDMATYGPILRLVFGKYGIPLYLSGTDDILQSGAISTLLWALDAALGGFERQDVLRYARSILSPLEPEEADLLENYAVIWTIGGNQWLQEWEKHPQGLAGIFDDNSRALLARINLIRGRLMDPLAVLREGFQKAMRLEDMVLAVYRFLEDIRLADRLNELAQAMDRSGDNRSAQILNQLWEILLGALEQLHDVLGNSAWEVDSFVRLLRLLLSQYDVGTIPPVLDSVMVGPVTAMRCQQQKNLIVLGAEEGNLPRYAGSNGLLSDQERVMLRKLGVPLTGGAMDGLQVEYAEIYGVFCGAQQHISICCSGQPSFLYQRLASMAGREYQYTASEVCVDTYSAGAMLTKTFAADKAKELGILDGYMDCLKRKDYALGVVSPENIRGIYGNKLILSASQVDRQAECRLSYFLKYGLRAQERKEATVDPAEFGTYVHAVLEETGREVMEKGGFHQVDLDTTLQIAMEHSKRYADEHFSQLESQRLAYLFRRNAQELEMVVRELWRELNQASYEPGYFELKFDRDGMMPAIEIPSDHMQARLRGFVDRVDVWRSETCSFFRVVDYKTGKKDFDYCDVFNGVGLQMLLYLFALEDLGEKLISGDRVSAGVQYFPARAPYVSADGSMTEEEAEAERVKLWKRSGLLLANEDSLNAMDPSEKLIILCCNRNKDGNITGDIADRIQMGKLKAYVMDLLSNMVEQIASGNVEANPYTRGTSHDACSFCPYGPICRKDTVPGRRNYKAMTAQRFWDEIGKEETHE